MENSKAIPFNAQMAIEVTAGRKTQTRRILNPQPPANTEHFHFLGEDGMGDSMKENFRKRGVLNTWSFFVSDEFDLYPCNDDQKYTSRYKIGDILWVREPAKIIEFSCSYYKSWVKYQFSDGVTGKINIPKRLENEHGAAPKWAMPWKPAGVPNGCIKEMARTFLKVTNVRVERLQDISEEDAIAEGLKSGCKDGKLIKYGHEGLEWYYWDKDPRVAFRSLWQTMSKEDATGWNGNPWVWVYDFEVIK